MLKPQKLMKALKDNNFIKKKRGKQHLFLKPHNPPASAS